MKHLYAFLLAVLCSVGAGAQTNVFTEYDINTGTESSFPQCLKVLNDKMYFTAYDDLLTPLTSIWETDGTQANTKQLKQVDVMPGWHNYRFFFTECNGRLYFPATDKVNGEELWITDGTDTGTHMVKDVNALKNSYHGVINYITCGNKVFFSVNDGVHGKELWASDGTAAGTYLVKDINPGTGNSDFVPVISYKDRVYFSTRDSGKYYKIWVTDGTEAGTRVFREFNPGADEFFNATVYKDKLFMSINTPALGYEMWTSDGTDTGTHLFLDFNPGPGNGFGGGTVEYNGRLYFTADNGATGNELWSTDGTVTGTVFVKDINPGSISGAYLSPIGTAVVNGKLFFNGMDNSKNVWSIWVTDGSTAGTKKLNIKDVKSGGDRFIEFKDRLYFRAATDTDYYQLFCTDGTDTGSYRVEPPNATRYESAGDYEGWAGFCKYNGKLFFPAGFTDKGVELWSIDDTPAPPLGIPTTSKTAATFSIYPNPNKGNFTVQLSSFNAHDNATLNVYDITGKVVHSRRISGAVSSVQLADVPKGVYAVRVTQGSDVAVQRLVVD